MYFNPPFWYPKAELSMPMEILYAIQIKGSIFQYVLILFVDYLLKLPIARRVLALEIKPESRFNDRVALTVLIVTILLFFMYVSLNIFLLAPQSTLNILRHRDQHDIIALLVFIAGSIFIGSALVSYQESQLKAEDQLAATQERLRLAIRASRIGIWEWDIVHDIVTWDESMYSLYGIVKESFGGVYDAWLRTLHPDDCQRVNENLQSVIKGEHDYAQEYRIVRPDGSICFIKNNIHIEYDKNGSALRMVGVNIDITEEKKAAQILAESEQLYQALFEQAGDGAFIMDKTGSIVSVNEMFARLHGYTAHDIVSMGIASLDVAGNNHVYARVKRILAGETLTFEVEHRHKDGHHILFSVTANRISPGGEIFILAVHRDITERVRTERELAEAKAELETVFNVSPLAMTVLDESNKVRLWNHAAEQMFGWTKEETVDRTIPIIPSSEEKDYEALNATVLSGHMITQAEVVGQRKDGSLIDVSLSSAPILDSAGKIVGRMAILADITWQKRAEATLQKSLAEKEILLRELYHRTKNNMNVIISLLNMQAMQSGDESLARAFDDAENRIYSMALVHQKLYESGDLSRVSLKRYLSDLCDFLISSYEITPISITLKKDIEDINVSIDTAIPCGLIANELISNALKHAFLNRERGTITVTLSRDGNGAILLKITDDGIGVGNIAEIEKQMRMGLNTVVGLGKTQLSGRITFNSGPGFACELRFVD